MAQQRAELSPLPPPAPGRTLVNHLPEAEQVFNLKPANIAAVDRCLGAACLSAGFEVAEIWAMAGGEPMCLHMYAQPATIETYRSRLVGVWNDENRDQRHKLSPLLVERARKQESPLWFTSTDPDTPLHEDLPLNTAVVLPLNVDLLARQLLFVYFSLSDVQRRQTTLDLLRHLSKAAGIAISSKFEAHDGDTVAGAKKAAVTTETELQEVSQKLMLTQEVEETPADLEVPWEALRDLEFLVNGSRCTIYTAFYKDVPVVVKLLRKDVPDADVVRRELEEELGLLMRMQHPSIVRLVGAGSEPERFLLIERLDGGTLAQRCGNAVLIRDRRRRFRHKKSFTYMELLKCGLQLAEALRYMHDEVMPGRLVLHRDLKPDNVGFDTAGNVKLMDLGLSKIVNRSGDQDSTYELTGETGSLRYMAPEVARRQRYNEKADVYGWGMVLWEMATLRKPFENMGREEFFAVVVEKGVRPAISKKWPDDFGHLLATCWDPEIRSRPNFAAIASALEVMMRDAAIHSPMRIEGNFRKKRFMHWLKDMGSTPHSPRVRSPGPAHNSYTSPHRRSPLGNSPPPESSRILVK